MCVSSRTEHVEGDVESGVKKRQNDTEAPEEISQENPLGKAKCEFRISVHRMFSDANRVGEVMSDIKIWEEGR